MRKKTIEIEAADIPEMITMPISGYQDYIATHLIFTDSDGVVRATQGEYPLACTKAQLTTLIQHLQGKMEALES